MAVQRQEKATSFPCLHTPSLAVGMGEGLTVLFIKYLLSLSFLPPWLWVPGLCPPGARGGGGGVRGWGNDHCSSWEVCVAATWRDTCFWRVGGERRSWGVLPWQPERWLVQKPQGSQFDRSGARDEGGEANEVNSANNHSLFYFIFKMF